VSQAQSVVEAFIERRSAPRVALSGGARLDRPLAMSVRVVDIGLDGVLFSSSQRMDVGQCARLTARLGEVGVEADIEVRRVGAARDGKGEYNFGARFVALDEATKQVLLQFLSTAHR
jgi:hypothetical protein